MVIAIIRWSLGNRFLVLLLTALLTAWGIYSMRETPVDAIPDLSDVQVIIKTSYPGQAPQVVEDQVTYPLTTAMLAVPGAVNVRGYSFFGDSYVYIIFEDGTDLYWARSRVLEYLSQVAGTLPDNAKPALGPDATGVGWVFQYALVDRTGGHDLAQLRSIQDWFLKFELQTVPGVAEVATIGGMVKQYQVVVDPDRLRAYGFTLLSIKSAIQKGNQEVGGSVIEMGEAEYIVRATGYLQNLENLRNIPLGVDVNGTPVVLSDVAEVRLGPQMRRGVADLDGEGEVVGGVIIMRWGGNALTTIQAVKNKLEELAPSLPQGVEIVTTYDRAGLIERAVENLTHKLFEEFVVVMPDTESTIAMAVAERLRTRIGGEPVVVSADVGSLAVTVSIGGSSLDPAGDTPDSLLKRADDAMYEAKRTGRNRVIVDAQLESPKSAAAGHAAAG